jgi:hypothetical protein
MEPECSLLCSQEPATVPYPEPPQSNPHPPAVFPGGIIPSDFPTEKLYVFISSWGLRPPSVSSSSIWSP